MSDKKDANVEQLQQKLQNMSLLNDDNFFELLSGARIHFAKLCAEMREYRKLVGNHLCHDDFYTWLQRKRSDNEDAKKEDQEMLNL